MPLIRETIEEPAWFEAGGIANRSIRESLGRKTSLIPSNDRHRFRPRTSNKLSITQAARGTREGFEPWLVETPLTIDLEFLPAHPLGVASQIESQRQPMANACAFEARINRWSTSLPTFWLGETSRTVRLVWQE